MVDVKKFKVEYKDTRIGHIVHTSFIQSTSYTRAKHQIERGLSKQNT